MKPMESMEGGLLGQNNEHCESLGLDEDLPMQKVVGIL